MKYIILKRGPVHVSLKNRDNQVYVYFTGLFFNFRLKIGKNIYVLHSGCKSEIILITNYLLIFVLTSNSGYFSLSLLSYNSLLPNGTNGCSLLFLTSFSFSVSSANGDVNSATWAAFGALRAVIAG